MKENIEEQEVQNSKSPKPNKTLNTLMTIFAVVMVAVIIALTISYNVGGLGGYLTYENYQEIHNGMTYKEVVQVLDGHEGRLDTDAGYGGYTLAYYTWSNSSGTRCIVVGFQNGKVCAKSQLGLT